MAQVIREGVFAVNKPIGCSSAQVIRDCQEIFNPSTFFAPVIEHEKARRLGESKTQSRRRGFGKRDLRVKMGHGGTLDPLATGVLILGVGAGTKFLQGFLECTKTYETVVLFGASTDTYDRVGRILARRPYADVTRAAVEDALAGFRGRFRQVPPLYSALKLNGKPLYEYAREGRPIPREIGARDVEVLDLELVEWYEPGSHTHRWPAEEAAAAERVLAEGVWQAKAAAEEGRAGAGASPTGPSPTMMTPPPRDDNKDNKDDKAERAYESLKRSFEQAQDNLVFDSLATPPRKRPRTNGSGDKGTNGKDHPAIMSGALGTTPPPPPPGRTKPQGKKPGRGSNLVPDRPDPSAPPPWSDAGPPAARIRMTVTSGFYVRSFCHDLGERVGSAAMMAELCRSRQSDFRLGAVNCLEFEDIKRGEDVWAPKLAGMLGWWNQKTYDKDGMPVLPKEAETESKEKESKEKESKEKESREKEKKENESKAAAQDEHHQAEYPASQTEASGEQASPQHGTMVGAEAAISEDDKMKAASGPREKKEEKEQERGPGLRGAPAAAAAALDSAAPVPAASAGPCSAQQATPPQKEDDAEASRQEDEAAGDGRVEDESWHGIED